MYPILLIHCHKQLVQLQLVHTFSEIEPDNIFKNQGYKVSSDPQATSPHNSRSFLRIDNPLSIHIYDARHQSNTKRTHKIDKRIHTQSTFPIRSKSMKKLKSKKIRNLKGKGKEDKKDKSKEKNKSKQFI